MKKPEYFPVRVLVLVMLFTCCMYSYMARLQMSIAILPMTNITDRKKSTPECGYKTKKASKKTLGESYPMTEVMQANLLAAYYYGTTVTCIPGGLLAEKFGPLHVIGFTMLVQCVLTAITPFIAEYYAAFVVVRVVVGMMGGIHFPAVQTAISRWAPPNEKNKFVFAIQGSTMGSVITWPILAPIIDEWGWPYSFYVTAISNGIWCIFWYVFVADFPEKHLFISKKESEYIIEAQGGAVSREKKKKFPPYKKIFASGAVWALIAAQFGNQWGLYLLASAGPKFLSSVQGFDLTNSGILAATPYLCRLVVGLSTASICDVLRSKDLVTTTTIRRYFTIMSHIIPGVILMCMRATQCNEDGAISILALSMAMNGASTVTHLANAQDLSPNYAGTLYGIANCIGGMTGFITPHITGALVSGEGNNNTVRWGWNYIIGGIAYVLGGIIFMSFGKFEKQPWNENVAKEAEPAATAEGEAPKAK